MVVAMKRLELLLYHKEREQFLESLRSLGVVHIVQKKDAVDTVQSQGLQNIIRRGEKAIECLKKVESVSSGAQEYLKKSPQTIIEEYEALEAENEKLSQELQSLQKECAQLEPWGEFEVATLQKLADAGVVFRFYVLPKKKFESLDTTKHTIEKINERDGEVYFVTIDYGCASAIPADEIRLPEYSFGQIMKKIDELDKRRKSILATFGTMTSAIPLLESFVKARKNEVRYEQARGSMASHAEGKVLHLSGWVPVDKQKAVEQFLQKYSVYFTINDPQPDDDVPVKLKNSAFSKLFEPITGLYSLPLYSELDITPFMAPFFSLFFGLCLGDVGYGLIVSIASVILLFKVGVKMKPFAMLGIVLGCATIISGVLLNSFFGMAIFSGPGINGGFIPYGGQIFSPLASTVTEKGSVFPAMGLALVLGFVQILFGMILQTVIKVSNGGFVAGIQPVSSMMMIAGGLALAAHSNFLNLGIDTFTVGPLLVGKMLQMIPPVAAKVLLWGGLVLFFFFNNVDKKIFIRPAIGLWEFYGFTTGILGDVLSYLRLFALGLAGGLLGAAFNQIAMMFITSSDGTVNWLSFGVIGTVVILIIGHLLNLGLSLIGSFVHPLRLTFVEFYKNIGFKGGSKPYTPFTIVE
ncbi:MAG TPA: V-type ATPase 116kDa subunit family protein [Chitinispirillaceae bacterium]|nr:V-type ATPase 116kDa subunit family protein [Chitinispirillaceae bacterium]